MIRPALVALALACGPAAEAQPPGTPEAIAAHAEDAATTHRLNDAILKHNDAITARNTAASEAYQRELARYEEARAENERARAAAMAAADTYRHDRARYEAELARWRAERTPLATARSAPPAPPATPHEHVVCRADARTGSRIASRTCETRRD